MPPNMTFEQSETWAREQQKRSDSANEDWREKTTSLERLIETRCRDRMLAAGFSDEEMHGEYVRCVPSYVDGKDPRMPGYREAMRQLNLDERAKERVLNDLRGNGQGQTDNNVAVEQLNRPQTKVSTESQYQLSDDCPAASTTRQPTVPAPISPKSKRSTERGEARTKLIAALTKHHKYADDGCLNLEPIGNNKLARNADVDQATASAFFKSEFMGHAKYRATCQDAKLLVTALKMLNGDYSPHLLYGGTPPAENEE